MANANIINLPRVSHSHLRLHDFSNHDHNEVKNLVKHIAIECEDRDINGIIVIVASAKMKLTRVFRAGSLSDRHKVAVEAAKLHLETLIELSEEE